MEGADAAKQAPKPKLGCVFYATEGGEEPVRNWLRAQAIEVKKVIGEDIQFVQWSWPVGKPRVGSLGRGLREIRSSVAGVDFRVIFHIRDEAMVLLHAFKKSSQKTPKTDLQLALIRKSQVERADRRGSDT